TLKYVSIVIAFGGLAAAWFVFGGPPSRAQGLAKTFAAPHKLLSGKYYVDELYNNLFAKPLTWISENIFLGLGDRKIIDGTLNGIGSLGQFASGVLGKIQNGSLHAYALFVMVGIVSALLWSWSRA
ncbi:MAG: NADH-quinone oxidoreductase subunit L, partial [Gemmatimonadaceae bacterium]